jgi:hypothetical protein
MFADELRFDGAPDWPGASGAGSVATRFDTDTDTDTDTDEHDSSV